MKSGLLRNINKYLHRNKVGDILVARGKLSPNELQTSLDIQKLSRKPLGQILIEAGKVNPFELRFALATQSGLRVVVAVITLFSGLTTLSSRGAQAGSLTDIPQSIQVAFSTVSAGSIQSQAALFGTGERASTDLSAFTKWSAMFDRFSTEIRNGTDNNLVQNWRSNLAKYKNMPLEQMADNVNNLMNQVRYIGDKRNWGKSDYWETPIEFMQNGGDCEDFAIAKYVSLKALGVPDKLMRVAIVKDTQKNIAHAILIVYTKSGPMVLDNQIKRMTKANDIRHYKPIYSINRTAWYLHNDRDSNPTQIATASR